MKKCFDKHLLINRVNKAHRQNDFPEHKHQTAELYVCTSGSATDSVDGIERKVFPGDVFVLGADANHSQGDIKDFKCYIFQFDESILLRLADKYSLKDKVGFNALFGKNDRTLFENCYIDSETIKYVEQTADIMLNENNEDTLDLLFTSIIFMISTKCQPRISLENSKKFENIASMVQYIENNYQKNLSLEKLSELSHYSTRHFTRLMREYCGASPMEYLNSVRIRKACELLSHTSMNISQVGIACGFDDNNLFSRHFKTAEGISPSQYRKEKQENYVKRTAFTHISVIRADDTVKK